MAYTPISIPAEDIAEAVDATARQLDNMARQGVFGDDRAWSAGSGSRRPWHLPHVPEVAWACARLLDLGIDVSQMQAAAEIVRARPVNPDGEILVLLVDGPLRHNNRNSRYGTSRVLRLDHYCATPDDLDRVAAVVALRSFASVPPTADGDDAPVGRLSGVAGAAAVTPPAAAAPDFLSP